MGTAKMITPTLPACISVDTYNDHGDIAIEVLHPGDGWLTAALVAGYMEWSPLSDRPVTPVLMPRGTDADIDDLVTITTTPGQLRVVSVGARAVELHHTLRHMHVLTSLGNIIDVWRFAR